MPKSSPKGLEKESGKSKSLPLTTSLVIIFLFILPMTVIFMGLKSLRSPKPLEQRTESFAEETSWSRREAITISGSTAGAQTNYQIKITVAYDSDMQADFDDIRFTSSDETTLIDHWLESKTDSSTASFWVEVPSISASPNTTTIYIYYGNPSVGSVSNFRNTFTKDFDTTSLVSEYHADSTVLVDNAWTGFTRVSGSEGTYDTYNVVPCRVFEDTNNYKLYYLANSAEGQYYSLFYADSLDGVNWSNFQRIMTSSAGGNAYGAAIVKEGNTYHLWYSNNTANLPPNYVDGAWLEHCTSTDGIHFGNCTIVIRTGAQGVYDSVGLTGPHVLKNNGLFEMWYGGWDGKNWNILYANSTDGLNWSNFALALPRGTGGSWDAEGTATPTVILEGGVYKIWYEGYRGSWQFGYAESTTGKAPWTNVSLVVTKGSEGTYDTSGMFTPVVYTVSGKRHLLYGGLSATHPIKMIHAESGVGFKDSRGNNDGRFKGNALLLSPDGGLWDRRSDVNGSYPTFFSGKVLSLDGNGSYVSIPKSSSLNLNSSFTIEAWIKTSNVAWGGIATDRTGGSVPWNYYFFVENNGKLSFAIYDGLTYPTIVGNTTVAGGAWHHVVAERDTGNDNLKLFVDGVSDATPLTDTTTGSIVSGHALEIGGDTSLSRYFNGSIDELAIYNRSLSADEIQAHYERRKYVSPEPSLSSPTPTPTLSSTPTQTPTPTITPIPTLTPTNTPIPTSTPTNTPIPTFSPTPTSTPLASLTFKIKFQGIASSQASGKSVRVILKQGGVEKYRFDSLGITHEGGGVYRGAISSVTPGTYDILIKGWAHLQRKFNATLASGGNSQDWSGTLLLAGDFDGNNRLNIADIGLLLSKYTALSVPVDETNRLFDVDVNNTINISDFGLVLANYTALEVPGDE